MKKIVFFIVLVISLFIINNLVRSIYNLWQKQDLLTKAKNDVIREQKVNEALKKQLKVVSAPGYVEEEARNKLLLSREGEKIVLVPSPASSVSVMKPAQKPSPIWQQWIKLFF